MSLVFNTKLGEEGIAANVEKFKSRISENGTITNVDEWGKRKLAYAIEDETEGYYMLVEFTSAPEFPRRARPYLPRPPTAYCVP